MFHQPAKYILNSTIFPLFLDEHRGVMILNIVHSSSAKRDSVVFDYVLVISAIFSEALCAFIEHDLSIWFSRIVHTYRTIA